MTETDLVTTSTVPEDLRQPALIEALGFDKLNIGQRELALAICKQYDLDPMLRHLVIVDGKPYITRDGLLHVAHKSRVFDGIEVEQPTLDADGGKYWRTWAKVYRKDMTHPFRYPGRYPSSGGNAKYAEEMCIKVAEVMTLRRAFDVAAPVIEERWADDFDAAPVVEQPQTVTARIAARAAEIEAGAPTVIVPEQSAVTTAPPPDEAPVAVRATGRQRVTPFTSARVAIVDPAAPDQVTEPGADAQVPADFGQQIADRALPDEVLRKVERHSTVTEAAEAEGPTLEEFAALVRDFDQQTVKRVAKSMFPAIRKFGELTPRQLAAIVDALVETEDETDEPQPDGSSTPTAPAATTAAEQKGGITFCGMSSPYGDGKTCTMDAGHGGPHRAGLSAAW